MSLENVLANIPGLAGYLAKEQYNRQAGMGDLQSMHAMQGLMQQAQTMQNTRGLQALMADQSIPDEVKMQRLSQFGEPGMKIATSLATLQRQTADNNRERAFRADLEALGPNPNQDQLAAVAAKHGTPSDVLKTQQSSLDRAAQREAMIEQKKAQIEAQIQMAKDKGENARTLLQMQLEGRKELAAMMAAAKPEPAVTPVTVADPSDPSGFGTMVIDGRSGRTLGKGPKLTQTGAADQKLQLGLPAAKAHVASVDQNLDRLDIALKELDESPGLTRITGTLAGRTPNLTNEATGAQAKLDSIKAQAFVSALQSMRDASKTGGAVGNVSDKEGDKLQNTLAALGQAQSTADFKIQIAKARDQLAKSKAIIHQAFEDQYANVRPMAASPAPGKTIKISGDAEYNMLPKGAKYVGPDGVERVK